MHTRSWRCQPLIQEMPLVEETGPASMVVKERMPRSRAGAAPTVADNDGARRKPVSRFRAERQDHYTPCEQLD